MSLYDLSKRDASEDIYELAGVELVITSDEQLAKARATMAARGNVGTISASAQIKVTWKPKTYRKFIGDEEVTEEVDYIKMTKNGAISDEALAIVRDGGMRAVQKGMVIALPTNPVKADPDKQAQEYPRFMVAAIKAGLVIDVTPDGQLTSPQIGQLFRCRNGYEEFPTPGNDAKGNFKWDWEDTRSTFMRVPVAIVKDFVQPDELREYRYDKREDADGAGTTAATTTTTSAVSAADLPAAIRALGISGKPVSMIDSNGLAIITSQVGTHRALALLVNEVGAKTLSQVLIDRGLATVENDTLVVA